MAKFMLLLKGQGNWDQMSPSEMEAAYKQYSGWSRQLRDENRFIDGDELDRACKIISPGPTSVITDGPFAESKEAVGGYYMITANDLDEAAKIALGCPHLKFGGSVEVRPVVESPGQTSDNTAATAAHA
jgi:hypothetical protein